MVLNGLEFSQRPLSLTPRFFQDKPLDLLFRPGVEAAHFNRFKLERTLDQVFAYGCDVLFAEMATSVCRQEAVDQRFIHLDTTTFSVSGAYASTEEQEATIELTYGYSKDHRPDLKQAVLELVTSQDGGIPFISQSWDGNAADRRLFQARAADLIQRFRAADPLPYLVADSKLYTRANAPNYRCYRSLRASLRRCG
jgi:transposase